MSRPLPARLALAACAIAITGCVGLRGGPTAVPARPAPMAAARAPEASPAPPPRVVVRTVRTACLPRGLGPAPRYPDTDQALREAGGAADRYQLLAAGRLLRARRLALLERAVEACRVR